LIDKDSLKIKQLGHVLIEKVEQLFWHVLYGSLGQEIDANTIESQNMARSRNSIGETLARQTGSGLSAA
jgi:hypothetical protein